MMHIKTYKQIEANLKLAGFEDIKISDVNIKDEKTGLTIQTQTVEAQKPESKRNSDVVVEVRKKEYRENKPSKYETKNNIYLLHHQKRDFLNKIIS